MERLVPDPWSLVRPSSASIEHRVMDRWQVVSTSNLSGQWFLMAACIIGPRARTLRRRSPVTSFIDKQKQKPDGIKSDRDVQGKDSK
ncbi:hypothetical protein E4U53_002152, partial [Claviceps sorghi]